MTTALILAWLTAPYSLFGVEAPHWAWLGFPLLLLVERLLVKANRPEFRSLVGILTTALQVLLTKIIPLRLIPVVGPKLVHLFEVIAGVDLDGDGHVGAVERATEIGKAVERAEGLAPGTVTKDPPVLPILLLGALGLMTSCAHVGPVAKDFADCAGPEMAEACASIKPRVLDALVCSNLDPSLAPACMLAQLADLARVHGRVVVGCAVVAIRDAFSAPSATTPRERMVKARAAEWLKREEARGLRFVGHSP